MYLFILMCFIVHLSILAKKPLEKIVIIWEILIISSHSSVFINMFYWGNRKWLIPSVRLCYSE